MLPRTRSQLSGRQGGFEKPAFSQYYSVLPPASRKCLKQATLFSHSREKQCGIPGLYGADLHHQAQGGVKPATHPSFTENEAEMQSGLSLPSGHSQSREWCTEPVEHKRCSWILVACSTSMRRLHKGCCNSAECLKPVTETIHEFFFFS